MGLDTEPTRAYIRLIGVRGREKKALDSGAPRAYLRLIGVRFIDNHISE